MKKIILFLGILIIILLALTFYQRSKVTDQEGIKFTYKNQKTHISYKQIRSCKKINFTAKSGDMFNGYDILGILNSIAVPVNSDSKYIFHSKDGGTLNLIKEENEIFYLVFQEDTSGQFIRLVVPTDEFSQRWIKYLVAIEIE